MEIEKNKFFAKKSIFRSLVLLIICIPLLFGAVLKLFYYLPKDGDPISSGVIEIIQNLISKLYHGFEPIQWLWSISPMPSIETILTMGNFLILVLVVSFLWGIMSFQLGVGTIDELAKAKSNARKKKLEDEYSDRG